MHGSLWQVSINGSNIRLASDSGQCAAQQKTEEVRRRSILNTTTAVVVLHPPHKAWPTWSWCCESRQQKQKTLSENVQEKNPTLFKKTKETNTQFSFHSPSHLCTIPVLLLFLSVESVPAVSNTIPSVTISDVPFGFLAATTHCWLQQLNDLGLHSRHSSVELVNY